MFCFLILRSDNENYEISDDDDDLPFACYLCRQHFKKPVVTKYACICVRTTLVTTCTVCVCELFR